tara:strand:- start:2197 stop:2493 length:297 start_codon:yes stop_codon:yes gene_type:complete
MVSNVKFIELYNRSGTPTFKDYNLREIYINPDHVVCLRDDPQSGHLLTEGNLPEGLDPRQEFTNVSLNKGTYGQDIVVIGPVQEIHQKLYSQRELLKG